ncbi:MAG: tRNA (N6-threonylcarbamoyladenosine(37)-N6)-methyltransferase TrmO [Deltaproteobacteria bacterium]|nr:tRNA (N6-threonylcarbamoyladenosine(37)-N6)-methyltransferase TrmO [Deltaproteobacteria bacterium]
MKQPETPGRTDARNFKFDFAPIGIIHSPYAEPAGVPIQGVFAGGAEGTVELLPELAAGLADLEGFSHIILLYYFHLSKGCTLTCKPFLDTQERGVFATRAPRRPNPIGMSVVRLLGIEGCALRIGDVDIVDGTPLLDIKPYIPDFDVRVEVRSGWYESARNKQQIVSDGRFMHTDAKEKP